MLSAILIMKNSKIFIHIICGSICLSSLTLVLPVMGQENVSGLNLPSSLFPVLCWDPQHGWNKQHDERLNGLESIRDCHFTLAGIVQPGDIQLCEELGLKGFGYGVGIEDVKMSRLKYYD